MQKTRRHRRHGRRAGKKKNRTRKGLELRRRQKAVRDKRASQEKSDRYQFVAPKPWWMERY